MLKLNVRQTQIVQMVGAAPQTMNVFHLIITFNANQVMNVNCISRKQIAIKNTIHVWETEYVAQTYVVKTKTVITDTIASLGRKTDLSILICVVIIRISVFKSVDLLNKFIFLSEIL